ncbi:MULTISPECIES: glutamate synthase subunit beta [unclassified Oscillibacter]|jgi:glutamate synthase (NADPH/NADH) small chain|uniref:glutamate synthase subunit beta n=1 Tax=unclassified Oscillibacter TaxID=2629304 RepID=UPI0003AE3CC8|nr:MULTISPECIES: glutamate synthase subunit beta [unclassified Oscillibacter]ERK55163.1 pyridine nucleotide-disulfide oxidoreductase [Oscillibacter sp. KLE 1728]ERK67659.1 pyridine nucleotide-disulfide oxidoreductase [Oscillibacter sp. KLE 1745]
MGKPTGFLEYTRREDGRRPAAERVRDWDEFHLPLPEEIRRQQGARCMNCGVPFCQAGMIYEGKAFGCPLHNLIPEWNDMILSGNWGHALSRLLKVNSFPEFTGRVCPAPCENACICGIYGDPITVRDNELSIIEAAFGAGKLRPRRPPQWSGKKVCVVGSGPAGLAAADQLNRRGHMVTVIERAEHPGGLLMYGIPNMKLPKSVVRRRIDLMTEEGVTFVCGVDASEGAVAKRLLAEYDAVILCCGAGAPRPLGLDTTGISGVCYGTEYLKAAVERAQFGKAEAAVPSASGLDVVIIGTGDTASDCVATALRQGCRSVTQLVRRPRTDYLDAAGSLPLDYAHEEALAVTGQDPRRFGVQVQSLVAGESGSLTGVVTTEGDTLPCQLLIGATGFAGCERGVCEAFGVEADRTVRTAPGSYAANADKVFAAGDMRRGQSLVVWAIAEGRSAAAEVDRYLTGYTNLVRSIG